MWTGMEHRYKLRIHVCDMRARELRHSLAFLHYWIWYLLSIFGLWTGNGKYGLNFPHYESLYILFVPVSHVQSHPGMHASPPVCQWLPDMARFWIWTGSIRYHDVLWVNSCTFVITIPPRNWNLIFFVPVMRTESLTTISIRHVFCVLKKARKACKVTVICEKFIVKFPLFL